jgi:SSS family solute:Na+ symporter
VLKADITKADQAYPWLVNTFIPVGVKGVALAAMSGAIVSALSSMLNAAGTIFTFDIYKKYLKKDAPDKNLVSIGRISSLVAILIAVTIAPLLKNLDQAFQFIQEYTGFISPAIFALFFYGIFWKRTTSNSVLIASVLSIPISALLKYLVPDLPFLDRIGIVFLILSAIIIVVSLTESKKSHSRAIDLKEISFKTDWVFNTLSAGLIAILIVLYSIFW